jgi:hypothetical protein
MALGAQRRQILRRLQARGWKLAGCGSGIGLVDALALSFLVQSLLCEMSAQDPVTFLTAIAILALTVLAACHSPARRAVRVDPLVEVAQIREGCHPPVCREAGSYCEVRRRLEMPPGASKLSPVRLR